MNPSVAPRRGAWIEILVPDTCLRTCPSLPAGERGLKYLKLVRLLFLQLSLPAGERGLKYHLSVLNTSAIFVAPRRGAWIEIYNHLGK